MPVEAELADGTILEFPDGTTEQVIQNTVNQFIQEQTPFQVDPQVVAEATAADVGPLESLGIATGRGFTTIGRALGIGGPEDPATTRAFEQLQQERPITTFTGEVLGEAAPFAPAGLAVGAIPSVITRLLGTFGLGATEGGLIARGKGAGEAEQLAIGGATGTLAAGLELILPRLGRVGRQTIRRVLGKEPTEAVIDAAGNPSAEFVEALAQENRSFDDIVTDIGQELTDEDVDAESIARRTFLESQGLRPTRAQVTRNAADFQAQQEAAKSSGLVRQALEDQEALLTTRFDNAVLDTGGQAVTPTSTVSDALVGKASILDQEISDLYAQARQLAPGEKNIRFSGLAGKLRELAPSDTRAGGNIRAVVGELQTQGVLDEAMKVSGRVDVETAENIRKFMNSLHDPQNEFGNILLRQLKETLDNDVFRAAGEDVFDQARSAKRAFEQELTRAKVSKFDSRKRNLVRDVLENKVSADRFGEQIVFGRKYEAADLQQLKDYISTDAAGRAAFDDLRAEAMDTIKNRSFIGPEDAQGNRALSRDKLERSLAAIGEGKLKVLFTADERAFLNNMVDVAKLREPVRGTALGRGPSAQAISSLQEFIRTSPLAKFLVTSVTADRQGRVALRAPTARGFLPSPGRQAAAQAGAVGGVAALQEENNGN